MCPCCFYLKLLRLHRMNSIWTGFGAIFSCPTPTYERCLVLSRTNRQNGDFHQYAKGFPGGHSRERNRHHPSGGRGRGRGGGFGPVPPPNFPQNLPPEPFHNGTRHDFSENYPYHNEYRGYSGWEATGHLSTQWEDEYGYGLAGYERSFGEGSYGDVAGRYDYCNHHDDRAYFRPQQETTGNNYNYGLSVAGPDALNPPLYGDGHGIPVDSGTPQQQQQQHHHKQKVTWAPLPQSGGGDAVPLPCLHRPRRRWCHS